MWVAEVAGRLIQIQQEHTERTAKDLKQLFLLLFENASKILRITKSDERLTHLMLMKSTLVKTLNIVDLVTDLRSRRYPHLPLIC